MGNFGILSLLHLAALIYAGLQIANSSAETAHKVLWILVVALFPLIGLIVWFVAGPGSPKGR